MNTKFERVYSLIFKKTTLLILFGIAVFLLFRNQIESVWNKLVVDPFLSHIEESNKSDIVFISIIVLMIIYFLPKFFHRFIISWKSLLLPCLLSLLYLIFYRLNPNNGYEWERFHINILNHLRYADIILIYNLFPIILYFKLELFSRDKAQNVTNIYIDDPISNSKEDILKRYDLVQLICGNIQKTSAPKSVAFGVSGNWGIGKTSLMNLIKQALPKDQFITIDFSPWLSFSKNEMVKDFFNILAEKIEKYSFELPALLIQYAKEITEAGTFQFSNVLNNIIKDEFNEDYTIHALKINELLSKIDRKVVMFIDDLDRVDANIIINCLQLIRNSADFSNIIFIVAYDKQYVINAIEKINKHNPEKYLEKIFLTEYTIPAIKSEDLKQFIKSELIRRFTNKTEQIEKSFKNEIGSPDVFNSAILKNMRDCKRFLNYLIPSYSPEFQDEVWFPDFFQIELLRFRYPYIYILFESNGTNYLAYDEKNVHKTQAPRYILKSIDQQKNEIDIHLSENYQQYLLTQNDLAIVSNLLSSLFGSKGPLSSYATSNKLSIRYSENYRKYFTKRLFDDDLSEKEFEIYYLGEEDKFKNKIEQWLKEGKRSLVINKFIDHNLDSIKIVEEYKKHINLLFFVGRCDSPSNSMIRGYDLDDLEAKLDWRSKKIKKWFNNDEQLFKRFVQDIFTSTPSPYFFDSEFLQKMSSTYISDEFILTKEEMNEICVNYLEKYLDNNEKLDSNIWSLFHNCNLSNKTNSPKAKELIIKFITEKDLDGYLSSNNVVQYDPFDKSKKFIPENILFTHESFTEMINQQDENKHPFVIDIKGLFEEMKKHGLKKQVEYKFKYIPEPEE